MAEQHYQPDAHIFNDKGLVAYPAIDESPPDSYWNLEGFEVRQEGAVSSRLGRIPITTDGTTNNFPIGGSTSPVLNLARLKSVGQTYRYATSAPNRFAIYRRAGDTQGAYTSVSIPPVFGGLSGGRFSTITYRPSFSGTPYLYIADSAIMLKDNGTLSALQEWGFLPPFGYVQASLQPNDFQITSAVRVSGITTITTNVPHGFVSGQQVTIAGVTDTSFDGTFTVSTIPTALTFTYNQNSAAAAISTFARYINVAYAFASPALPNISGSTTLVIVTAPDPSLVGTFTVTTVVQSTGKTYEWSSVGPNHNWTGQGGGTAYFSVADASSSGGTVKLTLSGPDVTGNNNNYDYRLTLYNQNTGDESNPTAVLIASNMVAPVNQPVLIVWPSTIFTYTDTQATNFRLYRRGGTLVGSTNGGFDGWLLIATLPISATSFLDNFSDFQIANNPVLQIDNDPPCTVALASQYNSTTTGVPVAPGSSLLTVSDPTTFYVGQLVTVDSGANQEVVRVVVPLSSTQFLAYFQISHGNGVPVIANTKPQQAMNLAAVGFEQAFLAGDPINQNRLYYSKPQQPSAFPPQNYVEIGVPSDPIMAVVGIRGQIFVFTQSRIYRVLSVGTGTPDPIPTGSRHGLAANFAWAIAEDGIYYLSYDGVYKFAADDSVYVSEAVEWLLADKQPNLGPVDKLNPVLRSAAIGAYCKNEFFLSYTGISGQKRRLIYDTVKNRWRNDSVACDSMFFEEDTGELVIAESGDGMVYRDRRSDWDQEGFVAGVPQWNAIPLSLQTPCYNQGAPRNDKNYNEFMIDVDTGGTALHVFLLFDNGTTTVDLGLINTGAIRGQVTIPINGGDGQLSKNVALLITGTVQPVIFGFPPHSVFIPPHPVHLYQWHIKAAVDAEQRTSYDSYFSKFGTDEFKFVKQGYFEYIAPDPAGISFNVYLEGQTTPTYSFNLPQTIVRTSTKVRFPAFKGKIWRYVATSPTDFKLFGESFIEFKPITVDKGYSKMNLGQISAQGGV